MTGVFAFLIMLAIIGAMSIGVICGRKPIAGSCGGMAQAGLDTQCDVCGGNPDTCREKKGAVGLDQVREMRGYDLTRDATRPASESEQR